MWSGGGQIGSYAPRHVVGVSDVLQRAELIDVLWDDATSCDVIVVESIARGYSRIKELTPDLVVVLAGTDDAPVCQLLSMLKMDRDTSAIPVVIWMTGPGESEVDEIVEQLTQDPPSQVVAIQMN